MNQLDKIIYQVTKILKLRQRSRAFRYLSSFMGCAVVFATTYSLILPAITIEYETASEMSGIYLEDSSDVSGDNTGLVTDGFEASPDTDLADASDQTSLSDQAYTSDQASPLDPAYTSDQSNQSEPADPLTQTAVSDPADVADFTEEAWVSQENGFNDAIASDAAEDAITGTSLSEAGTADSITVTNASTDILYDDDETGQPVVSGFSQASLQAASGNIRLQLDFPDFVPAETTLTFRPVEAQYFNNYYNGAKREISREFPDWSDFGYRVTDGKFWKVTVGTGSTEIFATFFSLRMKSSQIRSLLSTGQIMPGMYMIRMK